MTLNDIISRLQNLPRSFRRPGVQYTQLEQSLASGIARYAGGVNGLVSQTDFTVAQGSWLQLWGNLFGFSRNSGENDEVYRQRIIRNLTMSRATPVAIELFMYYTWGAATTVSENFSAYSWSMIMPPGLATNQYSSVIQSLSYVRPAGIPFSISVSQGGLYVGASNYVDMPRQQGAYLLSGNASLGNVLSPNTNNNVPLLPTSYMTDPLVNGEIPGL